jgi:3-oxoacyl-[acyl-carrier-protein] synthase II
MRAPTDVVVTGLGAVTPLAAGVAGTWEAVLAGRSGVRALEREWADSLPVRIAAPVVGDLDLPAPQRRRLDRSAQFALVAAREAWRDAGFAQPAVPDGAVDAHRVAVVLGCGMGGLETTLDQVGVLAARGARHINPFAVTMLMPNGPAAHVGLLVGARAGVHSVSSACASGGEALARGAAMIRAGEADVVVVGGTEAIITPLALAGFAAMRALSTRNAEPESASRPFDVGRDGFVMGEGAGVLVLESAAHAAARGACGYAEVAWGVVTSDSHHIAGPHPEADGLARAVATALEYGGMSAEEVVHVNAHATSTPAGDLAEAVGLRRVLGPAADRAAISATKSMTGHLIAAAGAVEAILTVLALHHRLAPPTVNLRDLDPAVDLDVVGEVPRPLPAGPIGALSTSLGFGGHNAALLFRTGTPAP